MLPRHAVPADADAIARVQCDAWRAAYAGLVERRLLEHIDLERLVQHWRALVAVPQAPIFVVEEKKNDGRADVVAIAGFVCLVTTSDADDDPATTATVHALYVRPESQRRGHGRALAERTLAESTARGFATVTLWVIEANSAARAFWEALGYRADGARREASPIGPEGVVSHAGPAQVRYRRSALSAG